MNSTRWNSTEWNTTEEACFHLILGAITIFVHAYAIFLCYAVYDYQNEKPEEEKSLIDVLFKDYLNSKFWFLYYACLVQFISIFIPPSDSIIVYLTSHVGVFLMNFNAVSLVVSLYIQHVYVFHNDLFVNVNFFQ